MIRFTEFLINELSTKTLNNYLKSTKKDLITLEKKHKIHFNRMRKHDEAHRDAYVRNFDLDKMRYHRGRAYERMKDSSAIQRKRWSREDYRALAQDKILKKHFGHHLGRE